MTGNITTSFHTIVYLLVLAETVYGTTVYVSSTEDGWTSFAKATVIAKYTSTYEDPGQFFQDDYADTIAHQLAQGATPPKKDFMYVELDLPILTGDQLRITIDDSEKEIVSHFEDDRLMGIGAGYKYFTPENEGETGNAKVYIVFTFAHKISSLGGEVKNAWQKVAGLLHATWLDLDTDLLKAYWKALVVASKLGNSKNPNLEGGTLLKNGVIIFDEDDSLIAVRKTQTPANDLESIFHEVAGWLNEKEGKGLKIDESLISIEVHYAPVRFVEGRVLAQTDEQFYLVAVFTFIVTDVDPSFETKLFEELGIPLKIENSDKMETGGKNSLAIEIADTRAIELNKEGFSRNKLWLKTSPSPAQYTVSGSATGHGPHGVTPEESNLAIEVVVGARILILNNCLAAMNSTSVDVTEVARRFTQHAEWEVIKKSVRGQALAQTITKSHLILVLGVDEPNLSFPRTACNAPAMLNAWKLANTKHAPKTLGESGRALEVTHEVYLELIEPMLPLGLVVTGQPEKMKVTAIMFKEGDLNQEGAGKVRKYKRRTVEEKLAIQKRIWVTKVDQPTTTPEQPNSVVLTEEQIPTTVSPAATALPSSSNDILSNSVTTDPAVAARVGNSRGGGLSEVDKRSIFSLGGAMLKDSGKRDKFYAKHK